MKRLLFALPFTLSVALLTGCGSSVSPQDAAEAASASGDLVAARLHLIEAIKQDPDNSELRMGYAHTLNELGDGVGAQAALEKLPDQDAMATEASALMAHSLLIQGKHEKAIEAADRAEGQSALAEWAAIGALLASGSDADAYDRLAVAEKAFPDDLRLMALGGEMALKRGNIGRGMQLAEKGVALDSGSLPIRMLAGRIALLREDYAAAEEHFLAASQANKQGTTPLVVLAATQADLGKIEDSKQSLARLLGLAPKHPHGILLKAKLAFAEGDIEEANRLLQTADKPLRGNQAAQLLGGEIDHLRGNHQSAIMRLLPFIKRNPDHIHGSTILAQALIANGETQAAWDVVQMPARRAAASPQLLAVAAKLAKTLGRDDPYTSRLLVSAPAENAHEQLKQADTAMASSNWVEATKIYRELRADGFANHALVLNNGALAELGTGNHAQALKLARQANVLVPDDPQVKDTLGWVLLQSGGSNAEALALVASASKARPTDLEIRWHHAVALARNGRKAEARRVASAIRNYARPEQRALIDELLAKL